MKKIVLALTFVLVGSFMPVSYTHLKVTLLVAVIELAVGFIGNFFNPTILEVMLLNASVWIICLLSTSKRLRNRTGKRQISVRYHSLTCNTAALYNGAYRGKKT